MKDILKFTDSDLKEYVKNACTPEKVICSKFPDEKIPAELADEINKIIKKIVFGALLAIKFRWNEAIKNGTAENLIQISADTAEFTYNNFEPHENGYINIYLPIKDFFK